MIICGGQEVPEFHIVPVDDKGGTPISLVDDTLHRAKAVERMRASQRSRAKYPLATISAYGPDNRRATKLVVGILRRAGQNKPNPMRSWSDRRALVWLSKSRFDTECQRRSKI